MSDDAFASPITDKVKGQLITYSRIGNSIIGTLENEIRQNRLRSMNGMLDQCKLQGRERFDAMADRYTPWINEPQIYGFLLTREGAQSAVLLSLKASGIEGDQAKGIVDCYLAPDLMNLALALAGFARRLPRDQYGCLIGIPASNGDGAKGDRAEVPVDPTETSLSRSE